MRRSLRKFHRLYFHFPKSLFVGDKQLHAVCSLYYRTVRAAFLFQSYDPVTSWCYDIPVVKKLSGFDNREKFSLNSWRTLWRLAKVAAPLGLVGAFQILFASMPRLFLDKTHGKESVGYFAAITSLLVLGTMVIGALSQVVSPRLAKYYCEDRSAYKLLIGKLLLLGIGFGIIGIVVSLLF